MENQFKFQLLRELSNCHTSQMIPKTCFYAAMCFQEIVNKVTRNMQYRIESIKKLIYFLPCKTGEKCHWMSVASVALAPL